MIRFIMQRCRMDRNTGLKTEQFFTFDANVPELEAELTHGGTGPDGYDIAVLQGAIVLPEAHGQTT